MSELMKFEATEAWKNKLKKHLLMERKTVLASSDVIKETQRFSLDIGADLQNKIPLFQETPKTKMFDSENKENEIYESNIERNNMTSSGKSKQLVFADESFINSNRKDIKKEHISDASFEVMEQMCNKTASDPDSTLFQFLHCDNKKEVMEASKKRLSSMNKSPESEQDAEEAAIDRLLKGLRTEEQDQLCDESPLKGVEMTQIEDIEEPSRFWENTISYEPPILQTSPVKMVGLLRPSTILEEYGDDSGTSSAHTSYKSAMKAPASEISSSCYETASDTMFSCKSTKFKNQNEKSTQFMNEEEQEEQNESLNLIDLEKTMPTNLSSIITDNLSGMEVPEVIFEAKNNGDDIDSDLSIIELLSDDEEIGSPSKNINNIPIPFIKIEPTESVSFNRDSMQWDDSCSKENIIHNSLSMDSSNNDSHVSSAGNESKDKSLHFNDTLEEVEFMMKKGMEFMAAGAVDSLSINKNIYGATVDSPSINKNTSIPNLLKTKQSTFTISPRNVLTTPKKQPEVLSTKSSENRFAINIKPIPKIEMFKKPVSACKAKTALLGARPKDPFAHVVSPIGTYMKKTAKTPLMTTSKTPATNLDSTAFLELEIESRLYQPKVNDPDFVNVKDLPITPRIRTLPKKAYISSEFRKVVDERSPITIPGGKKIQKYLDSALTPAVLCHDGKVKIASKLPIRSQTFDKQQDTQNASLANLSVMSGDVSVYTIKDAQKL